MKTIVCKCPLCKGSGKILRPAGNPYAYTMEQIKSARKLFAKGLTLRQIAQEMGIKHPQTISNLIRRKLL